MKIDQRVFIVFGVIALLLVYASCAPGNAKFEAKPAGFWSGLWHGIICVITFIISLFTDNVRMYEVNNTGNWYNFGFLIGAMIVFGGSCGSHKRKKRVKSEKQREWEEIGSKVEEKVRKGIKNWVDEADEKAKDCEEIGNKIAEKIKRELRNWAEK